MTGPLACTMAPSPTGDDESFANLKANDLELLRTSHLKRTKFKG